MIFDPRISISSFEGPTASCKSQSQRPDFCVPCTSALYKTWFLPLLKASKKSMGENYFLDLVGSFCLLSLNSKIFLEFQRHPKTEDRALLALHAAAWRFGSWWNWMSGRGCSCCFWCWNVMDSFMDSVILSNSCGETRMANMASVKVISMVVNFWSSRSFTVRPSWSFLMDPDAPIPSFFFNLIGHDRSDVKPQLPLDVFSATQAHSGASKGLKCLRFTGPWGRAPRAGTRWPIQRPTPTRSHATRRPSQPTGA